MLCPFCKKANKDKKYVKAWNTKILQHLVVTLSKSEDERLNWHVHGPIGNTNLMEGFLRIIAHESKIAIEVIRPVVEQSKVIEESKNEAEAKTE